MSATHTIAAVRAFDIHFDESELTDMRRRITATRWPERETVDDDSQGVPLTTMQELAHYWATDYDWGKCEARLNALPNFLTEIDGPDIHFIWCCRPAARCARGRSRRSESASSRRQANIARGARRPSSDTAPVSRGHWPA